LARVVIVSGFRICPEGSGAQVRTSGIARALARSGYEVLIYSLGGRREDYHFPPRRFRRSDPIENRLVEETNLGLGFGLAQAVLRRLGYPRTWQHWLMSRGLIPRRLRAALSSADVIVSDMVFCAPVPGPWFGKPWFLISHQIEHKLLEHVGQGRQSFVDRVRKIETEAPTRFSDIFAVSEDDQDFFRANDPSGRLRVPIVRCGVDINAYVPAADDRRRVRSELGMKDDDWLIVFSGSRFGPNLDALDRLKQFARNEAAFLAKERVYFLVLGSIEPTANREGAVISTGRVPSVKPYFAASDAGINPMTLGAGSNVKLFEYLAASLPVISTAFGARGTELQPERDYIPIEHGELKGAIAKFVTRGDRAYWREFAEAVLARHRRSIDIGEAVADAIKGVRDFPPP
jgi:glycosyltransferase involved in cell wall biosynthesis